MDARRLGGHFPIRAFPPTPLHFHPPPRRMTREPMSSRPCYHYQPASTSLPITNALIKFLLYRGASSHLKHSVLGSNTGCVAFSCTRSAHEGQGSQRASLHPTPAVPSAVWPCQVHEGPFVVSLQTAEMPLSKLSA